MFNVKKYQIGYYYDSFIGSASEIRIFSKPAETNREGVQNQEDWPVGNLNYFWVASMYFHPLYFYPRVRSLTALTRFCPFLTTKGQLISKVVFGIFNSSEKQTKTI